MHSNEHNIAKKNKNRTEIEILTAEKCVIHILVTIRFHLEIIFSTKYLGNNGIKHGSSDARCPEMPKEKRLLFVVRLIVLFTMIQLL